MNKIQKFKLLSMVMLAVSCSHTQKPISIHDLMSKNGDVTLNNSSNIIDANFKMETQNPNHNVTPESKMIEYFQTSDWDNLIKESRSYLINQPFNELALTMLSTGYLNSNKISLAHYYADQVLLINQTNSTALNIKGVCSYKTARVMDDYRNALAYFNMSFQANKREFAAGINAGYLQLELGNNEGAAMEFERVIKRCPDCIKANLGKGIAFYRMHKTDESQKILSDIIDLSPQNTVAMYYLALSMLKYDQESANKYFEEIIRIGDADSIEIQEKSRFIMRANFIEDKNQF